MQLTAPPANVLVTTTRAAVDDDVVTGVPVVPTAVVVAKLGNVATYQLTLTGRYFEMC